MKKNVRRIISLLLASVSCCSLFACGGKSSGEKEYVPHDWSQGPIILDNVTQAKNVILLIGDGMGPNQIKAGEIFKGEELVMQQFPYSTKVETRSADSSVTDSAAAGTALSTGTRTNNGYVGKHPNGFDLRTIVDIAHDLGKRTGVITTEALTGATPMAFSAHATNRGSTLEIVGSASDAKSNVDLYLSDIISPSYTYYFEQGGYTVIDEVDDISKSKKDKVIGSYLVNARAPSMNDELDFVAFDRLVWEALEYLSKDKDGFFLMAEGAHIDHGGHNNDMVYMLDELLAFDLGVKVALEWAKDRDDTVVIVTADHETGGLQLDENLTHDMLVADYDAGGFISEGYEWTTTGHSSTDVWCYINGADIDFSKYALGKYERIQNVDIFKIMKELMGA